MVGNRPVWAFLQKGQRTGMSGIWFGPNTNVETSGFTSWGMPYDIGVNIMFTPVRSKP
jgi:hypothetical protein